MGIYDGDRGAADNKPTLHPVGADRTEPICTDKCVSGLDGLCTIILDVMTLRTLLFYSHTYCVMHLPLHLN